MLSVDKHVGMQAREDFPSFSPGRTGRLVVALMHLRLDPAACILALDLEVCIDPRRAPWSRCQVDAMIAL